MQEYSCHLCHSNNVRGDSHSKTCHHVRTRDILQIIMLSFSSTLGKTDYRNFHRILQQLKVASVVKMRMHFNKRYYVKSWMCIFCVCNRMITLKYPTIISVHVQWKCVCCQRSGRCFPNGVWVDLTSQQPSLPVLNVSEWCALQTFPFYCKIRFKLLQVNWCLMNEPLKL